MWDEIIYPIPNFSDATVEVIIPTLLGMWLFIHAGIKDIPR